MKKCKKCDNEFQPQTGLKNYCSLKCANSRVHTEETKNKISSVLKNSKIFYESIKSKSLRLDEKRKNQKQTLEKKLLDADLNNLKHESVRKRIILEQKSHCNKCNLNEWLGQPIMLELEHKDGNRINNTRDNLEALCPNCHSQTEFWRGRNKNKFGIKVREENLIPLIKESKTIAEVLRKAGLAEKGNNYKRIRAIMIKHGLYEKFGT